MIFQRQPEYFSDSPRKDAVFFLIFSYFIFLYFYLHFSFLFIEKGGKMMEEMRRKKKKKKKKDVTYETRF